MLTDIIGGSELTVPAHATVMMFGRSPSFDGSLPAQDTMTTGTGLRIVDTPMLVLSCFAKSCLLGDKRCYCEERLVKEQIILDIKACGISHEIAVLAYDPVAGHHYRYRVV